MDGYGTRASAQTPLPWCPAPPGRGAGPGATGPRRGDDAPAPVLPWLPAPGGGPGNTAGRSAATDGRAAPRRAPTARGLRVVSGHGRPATLLDAVARLDGRRRIALLVALVLVVTAGAAAVHHWTGGRTVSTPFLSYTAPAGWVAEAPDAAAPLDSSALSGAVRGPGYDCGGQSSVRGFAAAVLLPTDPAAAAGPADRGERVARWFAATSYAAPGGGAPEVTLAPPRPVRVPGPDGGVDATVVEATARTPARDDCPATSGTVLALAAPVSGGAAVLIVAGDTAGGPAEPAATDRATLDAVLASVRLG